MTITEQNYPLLKFLHWDKPLSAHPEIIRFARAVTAGKSTRAPFLEYQEDERPSDFEQGIRHVILSDWPKYQQAFASRIEMMSNNFALAFTRSYDAFASRELFNSLRGKPLRGTVIMPGGQAVCYDFTLHRAFRTQDGKISYSASGSAIRFDGDGNRLVAAVLGGQAYDPHRGEIPLNDEKASGLFDFIISYTLFKRYANIEVHDAKSSRKATTDQPEVKTVIRDIRFLDASWYTTIVRTEGFGVKGHFRLQPCGEGRKDRKLIYIHEFQKHGYVRRAKMLADKKEH